MLKQTSRYNLKYETKLKTKSFIEVDLLKVLLLLHRLETLKVLLLFGIIIIPVTRATRSKKICYYYYYYLVARATTVLLLLQRLEPLLKHSLLLLQRLEPLLKHSLSQPAGTPLPPIIISGTTSISYLMLPSLLNIYGCKFASKRAML
jgi:hypothetical protein